MAKFKTGNDWYESLPESVQRVLEGTIIYDDYYSAIKGYALVDATYVLLYDRDAAIDDLADDIEKTLREEAKDTPVINAPADDPGDIASEAYTQAAEFFSFNVEGGWLGCKTPLIMIDPEHFDWGYRKWPKGLNWLPKLIKMFRRWPPYGLVGVATRCSDIEYAVFRKGTAPRKRTIRIENMCGDILDARIIEMEKL